MARKNTLLDDLWFGSERPEPGDRALISRTSLLDFERCVEALVQDSNEQTLTTIAEALGYVNWAEGTGGYERIDNDRLLVEFHAALKARPAPAEPQPDAPTDIAALPAFWDERRKKQGKPDASRCAAELRIALAQNTYAQRQVELEQLVDEQLKRIAGLERNAEAMADVVVKLQAKLAAREATGGEVTLVERQRVFDGAMLDYHSDANGYPGTGAALTAFLSQRACGSAPKSPHVWEKYTWDKLDACEWRCSKCGTTSNVDPKSTGAAPKAAAPVEPHEYSDEQVEAAQAASLAHHRRHGAYCPDERVRKMLAAASVPPVPAAPVEGREASVWDAGYEKGFENARRGLAQGDEAVASLHDALKRIADLEAERKEILSGYHGHVIVEPLSNEERQSLEYLSDDFPCDVRSHVNVLCAGFRKRFPQPTPAPVAAPKGRSAADIRTELRSYSTRSAFLDLVDELVALAERRDVPPAVAEVLLEMKAYTPVNNAHTEHDLPWFADKIEAALAGREVKS